jgi:hypothetical protein
MVDAVDQFLRCEGQGKDGIRVNLFHFPVLVQDEQDGKPGSALTQRLADALAIGPQGGCVDYDQFRRKTAFEAGKCFAATGYQFNNEAPFPQGGSKGRMFCVFALYEQKRGVIHDFLDNKMGKGS